MAMPMKTCSTTQATISQSAFSHKASRALPTFTLLRPNSIA